ncbi:hypothetical protein BY458DRAFT_495867 [Sporodiniella umbellata]|nr:hypothetical protein BY458DRAFT_495867 [Sporodiniella umbellata]
MVLFIVNRADYNSWCVRSSASALPKALADLDPNSDYYNCDRLWQDETKFGIFFYILSFSFYVYWAMCIYSFRLYRPEYISDADIRHAQAHHLPLMGPSLPQPAMASNPPGSLYPPDRSVIVLNNQKPSSKKSPLDSFKKSRLGSFRPHSKRVKPLDLENESGIHLCSTSEFEKYY